MYPFFGVTEGKVLVRQVIRIALRVVVTAHYRSRAKYFALDIARLGQYWSKVKRICRAFLIRTFLLRPL